MNIGKDQLQQLVHNLSFIYPRSTTPVSIPTPAKLADLLCERIKVHLQDVYCPNQSDRDAGRRYNANIDFNGQNGIHSFIRDTMYYL
jgi:hypothetical protein